jgi:hypothetical protein
MQILPIAVNATNIAIASSTSRRTNTTESEILSYFVLILAMALDTLSAEEAFCTPEKMDPRGIKIAPDYGRRFQMSFNRFKFITQCLSFGPQTEADPWSPIRPLIDSFNNRRQSTFTPGDYLVIDESMSKWRGADGAWTAEGLPHVTKIIRKPVPVGCEIKCICDGKSKIMMGK